MSSTPHVRQSSGSFGGLIPDPADLRDVAAEWHRAIPYTRLTDYGVDSADARELLWRTARNEDWISVGVEIGRRQRDHALRSAESGHFVTAREAAGAAAAMFNVAQIPIASDGPRKLSIYREHQAALALYAKWRRDMERLALDTEWGPVEGWLALPEEHVFGTVVMWGGLSGWGGSYLAAAESLAARGLACILAEGPGQGATRLNSRIYGHARTLPGYIRFLDFATTDDRLAHAPVGIQGNSFGGLVAARVAVLDERVAACVVNCAPSSLAVPPVQSARDQIFAYAGTEDAAVADTVLEGLRFDPEHHRFRVPLLVLHGGADPFVTEENARRFLTGAEHLESRILVWPDGEHTLYNHASERNALIADWFADQFIRP